MIRINLSFPLLSKFMQKMRERKKKRLLRWSIGTLLSLLAISTLLSAPALLNKLNVEYEASDTIYSTTIPILKTSGSSSTVITSSSNILTTTIQKTTTTSTLKTFSSLIDTTLSSSRITRVLFSTTPTISTTTLTTESLTYPTASTITTTASIATTTRITTITTTTITTTTATTGGATTTTKRTTTTTQDPIDPCPYSCLKDENCIIIVGTDGVKPAIGEYFGNITAVKQYILNIGIDFPNFAAENEHNAVHECFNYFISLFSVKI